MQCYLERRDNSTLIARLGRALSNGGAYERHP